MLNCFLTIEKNLPKFLEKKSKLFFCLYAPMKHYLLKLPLFVLFDIRNLNRMSLLDEKVLTDQKLFIWYISLSTYVICALCKNLQN